MRPLDPIPHATGATVAKGENIRRRKPPGVFYLGGLGVRPSDPHHRGSAESQSAVAAGALHIGRTLTTSDILLFGASRWAGPFPVPESR